MKKFKTGDILLVVSDEGPGEKYWMDEQNISIGDLVETISVDDLGFMQASNGTDTNYWFYPVNFVKIGQL